MFRERPYDSQRNADGLQSSDGRLGAPRTSLPEAPRFAAAGATRARCGRRFRRPARLGDRQHCFDSCARSRDDRRRLATVQPALVRMSFARADVRGTFGLVPERNGELSYRVTVDSMSGLARWLPSQDTIPVAPRPGRIRKAIKQAREDSAQIARATEVEREVTGAPAPVLKSIRCRASARDPRGQHRRAGTIRGNLKRFDMRGPRRWRMGTRDQREYVAARTPSSMAGSPLVRPSQRSRQRCHSTRCRRRASRWIAGGANHRSRTAGKIDLAIHQHESHDYRITGTFALHADHDGCTSTSRHAVRHDDVGVRRPSTIRGGSAPSRSSPSIYGQARGADLL